MPVPIKRAFLFFFTFSEHNRTNFYVKCQFVLTLKTSADLLWKKKIFLVTGQYKSCSKNILQTNRHEAADRSFYCYIQLDIVTNRNQYNLKFMTVIQTTLQMFYPVNICIAYGQILLLKMILAIARVESGIHTTQ